MNIDSSTTTRICDTCGQEKPVRSFWPAPMAPGGRTATCNTCRKIRQEREFAEALVRIHEYKEQLEQERQRRVEAKRQTLLAQGWIAMGRYGHMVSPLTAVANCLFGLPGRIYFQKPCTQYIYGLVDPRTGAYKYIGRTAQPKERLRHHISEAAWTWIEELRELGLSAEMQVLETITPRRIKSPYLAAYPQFAVAGMPKTAVSYQIHVNEREDRWILHGLQQGWDLSNNEARYPYLREIAQALPFSILTEPLDSLAWRPYLTMIARLEQQREELLHLRGTEQS